MTTNSIMRRPFNSRRSNRRLCHAAVSLMGEANLAACNGLAHAHTCPECERMTFNVSAQVLERDYPSFLVGVPITRVPKCFHPLMGIELTLHCEIGLSTAYKGGSNNGIAWEELPLSLRRLVRTVAIEASLRRLVNLDLMFVVSPSEAAKVIAVAASVAKRKARREKPHVLSYDQVAADITARMAKALGLSEKFLLGDPDDPEKEAANA